MSALQPLETLFETRQGRALWLPDALARLYGRLWLPQPRGRPYVYSNFVTTLDGVVSLNEPGHSGGGDISGFSAQDRMVMGVLRAIADAVVVASGTLHNDITHLWTAEHIYPDLSEAYGELRARLGKPEPPLNVIVTGSGKLDLRARVFTTGEVPALIVTTTAGAARLKKQKVPAGVQVRSAGRGKRVRARSILQKIAQVRPASLVLVEGGPELMAEFFGEHVLDEQFLTLAPQVAGRGERERPGLVMGRTFAPRNPVWGALSEIKRGESHLFLRYTFE